MADRDLIRFQEDFHLEWCNGFYASAVIQYPFGKQVMIYPGDHGDVLWYADLEGHNWTFDEIINVTERNSEHWFDDPAFNISESWLGDVDGFKDRLTSKGYKPVTKINWYLKSLDQLIELADSDYEFSAPKDVAEYVALHRFNFGMGDILCQRVAYQIQRPMSSMNDVFIGAYLDGVLCGGVAYAAKGAYGYYHSLAVNEEHRGKGLAKLLTLECFRQMREAGVQTVFSAVTTTNEKSISVHEKMGFQFFSEKEIWKKD